jgi:hypothetical protein
MMLFLEVFTVQSSDKCRLGGGRSQWAENFSERFQRKSEKIRKKSERFLKSSEKIWKIVEKRLNS